MTAEQRPPEDQLLHRVTRLQSELTDEAVPITDGEAFPASLRAQWPETFNVVCEEIVYARYVAVHEGHRPTYGCLIVADLTTMPMDAGILLTPLPAGDEPTTADGRPPDQPGTTVWTTAAAGADLRLIVDGEHTVLVRDLHGRTGFGSINSPPDDLTLLHLCRALAGVCVQRRPDGRIQILTDNVVCLNDGYDWRWLSTARRLLPGVLTALDPPDELLDDLSTRLGELMDLCVHTLSPRGIGATLVWRITTKGLTGAVSNEPSRPPADLNVFRAHDRFAIVALLASVDGACFVSRDGSVLNYWAMLDPSTSAKKHVAEMGGTRHTSAKRFSFDEPGSLVIVVSADGPVSIFSDGAMLARLADTAHQPGRKWITRLALADGAQVDSHTDQLQCPTCNKRLHVEVDTHENVSESEVVSCPVCLTDDLGRYEHVVGLSVRVIKDWAS